MNEASIKQKIILVVDAFLFLLCITGVYQISEKARLPFEVHPEGNSLLIKTEQPSSYHILNNSELISVDNIKVSSPEEIELITDKKNVGEQIDLTFRLVTSTEKIKVTLTNFYSTGYLLSISFTSLIFLLTAIFIIIRKPTDLASNIFHWACVGIACMIDLTWANNNKSVLVSYNISRIPFHFFYSIVPVLFLHFTFIFPERRLRSSGYILIIAYLIALYLGVINFFNYNSFLSEGNYENLQSYISVFNTSRIFLIICVVISILNFLYSYFIQKETSSRKKLKWVLYGFLLGPLGFAILWALPILMWDKAFVPEEIILLLMCSVPITFTIAIVKYHLLDIDYIINRSIVYTIVISILIILYISILSLIISNFTITNQTTVSIVSAVLIALILQPLKNEVQKYVDKIFFRVQYSFKEELSNFLSEIKQYGDVDELSEFLINKIDKLMPVEKIGFCLFDENQKRLYLTRHQNFESLSGKSLFIKNETLEKEFFRIAAEKNSVELEAKVSTIFQNTLLRWKINLVLPIISQERELYAVVLLGKKKSGAKFSIEDIEILKNISNEAASVIKRINLQKQLIMEKLEAEKLQELNRQKSIFVSSVSHDLKTPLTSIKLFVDKILNEEKNLSALSKRNLEIIDGETDRLTRLINNVLDFAKIERGIKTYSLRDNHLNEVVKKVIELMRYTLSMNKFELKINLAEFDDSICADEDALLEAFQNIISNSIKYSLDKKELTISTFFKDGYACVSFVDKGIGIKKSELEKVFEPFYQSSSRTIKADSTGLGLTIVKHIVEAHHGRVEIDSQLNVGTEVRIYLPTINKSEENHE